MTEIATRADIDRLEALVSDLVTKIEGATITPAPEWLTVAQMAVKLGVSRKTVSRRIESGEIEARGSGKTRMVRVRT